MRKRVRIKLIPALLAVAAILTLWPETAEASAWNNAVTYYNSYGNSVVFKSTSSTDGLIYYATKGKNATTTTTFSTVGWKLTIKNGSGTTLQNIYYKLGGSYMTRVDSRSSSGYTYILYSLSLYNIKRRMNAKATAAMESGSMSITLNACMVVVKNGKAKGAMTDSGPSSGTVYTTYSGIANAASWSSASKSSLYSYFDKTVTGLFYKITTSHDSGISSVSGGGTYFYGTYITLKAKVKSGYEFNKWTGTAKSSSASFSFYVNAAGSYKANSTQRALKVTYYRNSFEYDCTYEESTFTYGKKNQTLMNLVWTKNGNALIGWALSESSTTVTFTKGYAVTDSFIDSYYPSLRLYAVYQQPVASTSSGSTSTYTPSTYTPSTYVPSTTTPSTSTSDTTTPTETAETPKAEDNNTTKAVKLKLRFISSEYFEDESNNLVASSKGGLAADSKWATDSTLRVLLRSVLSK